MAGRPAFANFGVYSLPDSLLDPMRFAPKHPSLRAVPGALLLPFALAGCAANDAGDADAQPAVAVAPDSALGAQPAPTSAPAPRFAPEDTATRTAAEAHSTPPDSAAPADSAAPQRKYNAGESPVFAAKMGWPVRGPEPLPGSVLPDKRVVCYYGNPGSKRMGVLGEYPKDEMLSRLDREVKKWNAADPEHPVVPCLHLVAVVAQGEPGTSGHYRTIMQDAGVSEVHSWIKSRGGIFIVDMQVGTDDVRNVLPRFDWILKEPDVHLAVDPEFMMEGERKPGTKIGTMDASDINYVTDHVAKLVRENHLPPKLVVIHRFTRNMVTNSKQIKLRPEVQLVMDMDGWGAPWLKRDSYRDYIVREPVQFTGFKLFYHNDTKKGDPLMSPEDVLRLHPKPLYIQYQ